MAIFAVQPRKQPRPYYVFNMEQCKYSQNIALEITENPKIEKIIDGAKNAYFWNKIAVEEEVDLLPLYLRRLI